MALSKNARDALKEACPNGSPSKFVADEIIQAIDASTAKIAADVAAISTADATDLASSEALANQTKATVNSILTALKAAGLMS